jgi:hypothetical protein
MLQASEGQNNYEAIPAIMTHRHLRNSLAPLSTFSEGFCLFVKNNLCCRNSYQYYVLKSEIAFLFHLNILYFGINHSINIWGLK